MTINLWNSSEATKNFERRCDKSLVIHVLATAIYVTWKSRFKYGTCVSQKSTLICACIFNLETKFMNKLCLVWSKNFKLDFNTSALEKRTKIDNVTRTRRLKCIHSINQRTHRMLVSSWVYVFHKNVLFNH